MKIVDGGAVGLAMIVHYLWHWNTGKVYFFINLPIFLWAFIKDRQLFYRSLFGTVAFTFNMWAISFMETWIPSHWEAKAANIWIFHGKIAEVLHFRAFAVIFCNYNRGSINNTRKTH